MPKCFMRTYGQSAGFGDPFTSDMDTAIVELTSDLLSLCQQRASLVLNLAAQDEHLWEAWFWDPGSVSWWSFYPDHLIESLGLGDDKQDEAIDGQLIRLSDETVLKQDQQCRVECAQMRVQIEESRSSGKRHCVFGWGAYPKHSDVWVTTPTFGVERLAELVQQAATA